MICCNIEQATEEHFTSIMFVKTGQNILHGIDFPWIGLLHGSNYLIFDVHMYTYCNTVNDYLIVNVWNQTVKD